MSLLTCYLLGEGFQNHLLKIYNIPSHSPLYALLYVFAWHLSQSNKPSFNHMCGLPSVSLPENVSPTRTGSFVCVSSWLHPRCQGPGLDHRILKEHIPHCCVSVSLLECERLSGGTFSDSFPYLQQLTEGLALSTTSGSLGQINK